MKRVLTPVLVLAAVQGLLVVGYLLIGGTKSGRDAADALVRAQPLHGPAPDFHYRTLAGEEGRLSALRGQPVLVHFWATWCPPCREELPGLLALADSLPASPANMPADWDDLTILAVSLDPAWEPVQRFLGGRVPPAVVLASSRAANEFGVASLPETFLIDAAGRLRLRFAGAHDWRARPVKQIVQQALQQALSPATPGAPGE